MEITIEEAEKVLSSLIDLLLQHKEECITLLRDDVPVVKIIPFTNMKSKRIGAAKDELKNFDLSLDSFNSIGFSDFEL